MEIKIFNFKVRRPDPGPSLHPAVLKSMKRQEQSRKDTDIRKDPYRKDTDREADRRDADRRDAERRDYERKKNGSSNDKIKEEKRRLEVSLGLSIYKTRN